MRGITPKKRLLFGPFRKVGFLDDQGLTGSGFLLRDGKGRVPGQEGTGWVVKKFWRQKITYQFNHFRHWHHHIHFYDTVIGTKQIIFAKLCSAKGQLQVSACFLLFNVTFYRTQVRSLPLLSVTPDSCDMTWKQLLTLGPLDPWVGCVFGNVIRKWPNNDFLWWAD